AGIKPLDEAAGLVGVVPLGNVLLDHRNRRTGIIIKRNPGESALGLLRLLFEEGYFAVRVHGDGVVFSDLIQVADVVDGKDRSILLSSEFTKTAQTLAEQVVAR